MAVPLCRRSGEMAIRSEERQDPLSARGRNSSLAAIRGPRSLSVPDLVGLPGPRAKCLVRLGAHQCLHSDLSPSWRKGDFPVDEIVVKPDSRGVLACVAVIDGGNTGPVNRGKAHGAWLAARVERAIGQLEGLEPSAGVADRDNLGVRRRVTGRRHLVPPASDNRATSHHDAAKRAAPSRANSILGEADRLSHKVSVVHRHGPASNRRTGRKDPTVLWS